MTYMFDTTKADLFAVLLPSVAAAASIAAGIVAFLKQDYCTAALAVVGGLTAAGGIFSTYCGSKTRDEQMRLWIIATADAQAHIREGFGS